MKPLEAGDRVRYSAAWLRYVGAVAGPIPHARGTVEAIGDLFGKGRLVTVVWDHPDIPPRVLSCNLEHAR